MYYIILRNLQQLFQEQGSVSLGDVHHYWKGCIYSDVMEVMYWVMMMFMYWV